MTKKIKTLIICIITLTTSGFAQNQLDDLILRQKEVAIYYYGGCGGYTPRLIKKRVKLFVIENNRKEKPLFINTFLPSKIIFKKIERQRLVIVSPNYYVDAFGFIRKNFNGSTIEIPSITFKKQKQQTKSRQEIFM